MERFYKIGEISKLYHIGVDSLRYYERLGLIAPERSESGYRLYSARDIWRLNAIRDLRELGFGMEQIKTYLQSHTVSTTLDMLREELRFIEEKRASLDRLQKNVEKRIDTIHRAEAREFGVCHVLDCPPRRCFYLAEGYRRDEDMDILIKRLMNRDQERLYVVGSNQIGSVLPLSAVREGDFHRYQAVFLIDEHGEHTIEGGSYLSLSYRGEYRQIDRFLPEMVDYAAQNGWTLCGDVLEILWLDIHTTMDPAEYITELQIRVEKQEKSAPCHET